MRKTTKERMSVKRAIRKTHPNAYLYEFNQFKEGSGAEVFMYARGLVEKYRPTAGKNVGISNYLDKDEELIQGLFLYVYNLDGTTNNIWNETLRIETEIINKLKEYCLKYNLTDWSDTK